MIKIAVASGKGGTGKTFVATNMFTALSIDNQKVSLVDCDAEAPNSEAFFKLKETGSQEVTQLVPVIDTEKCTFCAKCHEYCNYNAIFILPHARVINVIEDLCHGCGACSVACEYGAITEKKVSLGKVTEYKTDKNLSLTEARINIGVLSPVPVIKEAIKRNNNAEVAILDSPPGTSCPFIHTVSSADYVILVTEPTPFGLSDLIQSVETLKLIKKPYGVIINRAGIGNDDVQKYLQNENITLLMEIPFSKEIAGLYSMGNLVAETDSVFREQMLAVFKKIFTKKWN